MPVEAQRERPLRWNTGTCKKEPRPHLENEHHICHEWASLRTDCSQSISLPPWLGKKIEEYNRLAAIPEEEFPGERGVALTNLVAYIGERVIALWHSPVIPELASKDARNGPVCPLCDETHSGEPM